MSNARAKVLINVIVRPMTCPICISSDELEIIPCVRGDKHPEVCIECIRRIQGLCPYCRMQFSKPDELLLFFKGISIICAGSVCRWISRDGFLWDDKIYFILSSISFIALTGLVYSWKKI